MDGTLVELARSRRRADEEAYEGDHRPIFRTFETNVPGGVVLYTFRTRNPGASVPGTFVPGCHVTESGLLKLAAV